MGGPGSGRRGGSGKYYQGGKGFPKNKLQHLRETRNNLRNLLKKYKKI